jgi:hypothetical protein
LASLVGWYNFAIFNDLALKEYICNLLYSGRLLALTETLTLLKKPVREKHSYFFAPECIMKKVPIKNFKY